MATLGGTHTLGQGTLGDLSREPWVYDELDRAQIHHDQELNRLVHQRQMAEMLKGDPALRRGLWQRTRALVGK